MAIGTNPFYKRASEHTTTNQEFVHLFSPERLKCLTLDHFQPKIVSLRTPPGSGKTSLLRIFTPAPLKALISGRMQEDLRETYLILSELGIVDTNGPKWVGVSLSCASGYADLPPTLSPEMADGAFRALLNCRIIIRTLRAVMELLEKSDVQVLTHLQLSYIDTWTEDKDIPKSSTSIELYNWAAQTERKIYAELDSIGPTSPAQKEEHKTFEAVKWLSSVNFYYKDKKLGYKPILLLDDVHKLRSSQRNLLNDELMLMRAALPIWLAERTIALSPQELLSQGAKEGRDYLPLHFDRGHEKTGAKNTRHFSDFVKSVVDRRLRGDTVVRGSFESCLAIDLGGPEYTERLNQIVTEIQSKLLNMQDDPTRYEEWIASVNAGDYITPLDRAIAWQEIEILIFRDQRKQQQTLDFGPLDTTELDNRNSSNVKAAAERFLTKNYRLPYYYGMSKLSALATNNIEEFLGMAAQLYDRLSAKYTLRLATQISPEDQQRILKQHANKRLQSIRKSHTHGEHAHTLLFAIGEFCNERTMEPNAPYAPGVTGVAITRQDLISLRKAGGPRKNDPFNLLAHVITECIAENLLELRMDVKQGGHVWCVFYLNRLVAVNFDLPLQYGGWKPTSLKQLNKWMRFGFRKGKALSLW